MNRWLMASGLLGVLSIVGFLVVPQFVDEPRPLGFSCAQPAQPVVEEALGVGVYSSGGVGGADSSEATSYWGSTDGRELILVTCKSLPAGDQADQTPTAGDPGYVAGSPAFLLRDSEDSTFVSELQFTYRDASVRIETASRVNEMSARALVTSWIEQVQIFSR